MQKTSTGFTLVELMVTIGVAGVMISIVLPALGGAKAKAGEVKSLANARSVAMSMKAYADEFGRWPFAKPGVVAPGMNDSDAGDPDMVWTPWWPGNIFYGIADEWGLSLFWPGLVAAVAPWEGNYATWVSPGRANPTLYDDQGHPTDGAVSYIYSNSFVGSPGLWRDGAAADQSFIAPTTPSMVEFPSNKVLVWDGDLAYLPRTPAVVDGFFNHVTPMAFVDQHAEALAPQDATAGVSNPLNRGDDRRLHNTPAGVLGHDY